MAFVGRTFRSLALLACLFAGSVAAGPLEDGVTAAKHGDYATALRHWRPLANEGIAPAEYLLGLMYATGRGVPQDDAEAVRWYRMAAHQGNAAAQYNLGLMHKTGRGVPQDDAEAVRWYRMAAHQGNADAQLFLGTSYATGRGVPRDDTAAVGWFRRAAEQGDALAEYALGRAYATGRAVQQDDVEAVQWYRMAAEKGLDHAQHDLGLMYADGRGVQQDDAEAVRWFRKAAVQGLARAQHDLGNMYRTGRGVPQDDVEAVRWYRMAADRGDAAAQFLLKVPGFFGSGVPVPSGDVRDFVSEAQRLLAQLGFDPGPVDGAPGVRTLAAIEAYQGSRRLPVDLNVTEGLVERLRKETAAVATPQPTPNAPELAQTGTGFFVTANGHLLTSAHLVQDCAGVQVRAVAGASAAATVLATTSTDDLALLRASTMPSGFASFRTGAPIRAGDGVVLVGFPLAGLLTSSGNTTTGSVTALTGPRDDTRLMQISAPVQPGNSGGPVLDDSGNIIGVVVSKLDAVTVARATRDIPQNVNFAIKASVATNFLEAHGVVYTTASSETDLRAADIAENARRFSVLVECFR